MNVINGIPKKARITNKMNARPSFVKFYKSRMYIEMRINILLPIKIIKSPTNSPM